MSELKQIKVDIDKLADTLISHNMVEAKRKLKKELADAQKLTDSILENELKEANK